MNLLTKAIRLSNGLKVLTAWLGSGGECVPKEKAQERADTCKECPQNIKRVAPAPGVVADAVREQVELKNNLQLRVNGEKNLGTCGVCQCVLRLKIWLPYERVKPQQGDNFPENCWIMKEGQ